MARTQRGAVIVGPLFERFSNAVGDIYNAALNPERWSAAVKSIASLHECDKGLLITPTTAPVDGGFVFPCGISESDLQIWASKYVVQDPWVRAAYDKDLVHDGRVMLGEELLPWPQFESSTYYREFGSRLDIWHLCSGIVFEGSAHGTMPAVCSLFRGRSAPGFTDFDKKLHSLTVGHLSRALGTMFRLRDAELRLASSIAALDRLAAGVVLFGARGTVTFANRVARDILDERDGLCLKSGGPMHDSEDRLSASRADEEERLASEIQNCLSDDPSLECHFSRGLLISRPSGRLPYRVQLSLLTPENEFSRRELQVLAIGFIGELGSTPLLDRDMLERVLGLTPAEASMAQEVLSGESIQAIATRLQITENTVKTHLRNLFVKTGTHRQAELVKLLMGFGSSATPTIRRRRE